MNTLQAQSNLASVIGAIFLIVGAACLMYQVLHKEPLTPQQAWVQSKEEQCEAMAGRPYFDEQNKTFACWRHTFFVREPKLLFKETFKSP